MPSTRYFRIHSLVTSNPPGLAPWNLAGKEVSDSTLWYIRMNSRSGGLDFCWKKPPEKIEIYGD